MTARRGPLAAVLFLCLGSLAWSAPAGAAPTWLSPAPLTPASNGVSSVAAGSDAAGNVVAAWVRQSGGSYVVEVGTRPAGGSFAVQPIQSGTGLASDVTVAVNRSGDAIVAWRRSEPPSQIWAATRPAGGSFGPAQAIAAVPGQNAFDPSVAINDQGAMIVVWRLASGPPSQETIFGAFRPPGGGFTAGAAISTTDPWNQSPRVALDSSGRATVVWSYWDGVVSPGQNIARVRIRNANGTLGQQRNLSGTTPTGHPMFATVGLDGAGNAVAVWSQWDGAAYRVQGAIRSAASDTWTSLAPFGQSASASFGSEPQVAVEADGDAVAIWRAPDNTISAASRFSGGGFGAAQTGISASGADNPRIVIDHAGNGVAVWRRTDGTGTRIEAAMRPPGGHFGAVRTLSATNATGIALSMDGLGNAFAVWPLVDPALPVDADTVAQFTALDASPPALTSVSVPATGTTAVPASFSASALDVWSPVSLSWAFGNGASAEGASVSHAYAAPGAHNVTVRAVDAVGHEASATRTIHVSNPQPPPPPRVRAVVSARWRVMRRATLIRRLRVRRITPATRVEVRCSGRRCPFRRKLAARPGRRPVNALRVFGRRKRLRPGQTIEVRVTRQGWTGKVVRYKVRRGKRPRPQNLCLPPGARPGRC